MTEQQVTVQDGRVPDYSEPIERELQDALTFEKGSYFDTLRVTIDRRSERWYGNLLVHSYRAIASVSDTTAVVPAATAVELLRENCHLQSQLVVDGSDRAQSKSLLGADYLHALAFSTLGRTGTDTTDDCFHRLTDTARSLSEALHEAYCRTTLPVTDQPAFVDGTAGQLGECAAVTGAILAGASADTREQFGRFGRGASVARQIRRVLDSDGEPKDIVLGDADDGTLREHANAQRDTASGALRTLAATVDVDPLRAHVGPQRVE